MTKEVQKWADEAMFKAEDSTPGPTVYLLAASSDPLGQIAACAKMYKGEVVRSLSDVTHAERLMYLEEMKKTKLKMPLEAVSMHFMIEGVTRGFTHQMVRQRTAAYAQESTRFAVKEDLKTAVALPPSLAGVVPYDPDVDGDTLSKEQQMLYDWEESVRQVGEVYMHLVNSGMPAEDARGLMPTNITTRLNYITNLRGLLDHAGNRLCTQAQFEWRIAFSQIAQAMRGYCGNPSCFSVEDGKGKVFNHVRPEEDECNNWQWNAIADLLQPVCYQTGKCEFKADFDRKCSIRDRVDRFADFNVPSSEWGETGYVENADGHVNLLPIYPAEWLADPAAAR